MPDWFSLFRSRRTLSSDAIRALEDEGFVVLLGLLRSEQVERLRRAYDDAAVAADAADVRVGSTTTRISDWVNRGAEFDEVYTFPSLLEACCQIIGRPFRLSSLH